MEQRRLLLALALSALVVFAYDWLVLSQYRQEPPAIPGESAPAEPSAPPTLPPTPLPGSPAGAADVEAPAEPAPEVVVETDDLRARISTVGARMAGLELKQFRSSIEPESPPLALVDGGITLPGTLELGGAQDGAVRYRADRESLTLAGGERGEVRFTGEGPGGLRLEKRYEFRGAGYLVEVSALVAGPKTPGSVGLIVGPMRPTGETANGQESAAVLVEGDVRPTLKGVADLGEVETFPRTSWAGFASQYFLLAAMPAEGSGTGVLRAIEAAPLARVEVPLVEGAARFALYAGPKLDQALADAGHALDRALDFGWFWFVALPLLQALRALDRVFGNYGFAIIVLTTLVKIATIPLTQVTYRNMREMQKIQPQMQKLRERFKNDQAALQKELMELYRRHRVNPFSGCLPMLLQLPIFVGLYNALMYAIELRHAPFVFWIRDLSAPDRLMVHVLGLSVGIPVLTILMGATMFVQQWLTPAQGDPTQQRIMMFMPLIFTFMFINFPAGLVLYWLINNVITIGQQYVMMRSS